MILEVDSATASRGSLMFAGKHEGVDDPLRMTRCQSLQSSSPLRTAGDMTIMGRTA